MGQPTWIKLTLIDEGQGIPSQISPSEYTTDERSFPLQIGADPSLSSSYTLPLEFLPSRLGIFNLKNGAATFNPSFSPLDLEWDHIRNLEETVMEQEPVELWSGDQLRFYTRQQSICLKVELEESDVGIVDAERPIADVATFTNRLLGAEHRLQKFFMHSKELSQSQGLSATLHSAATMIFELLPKATHVGIALKEERGKRYPVLYSAHRSGATVDVPMSRTLIKRVVERRAGLLIMNASEEFGSALSVLNAGLSSTLIVPLWTGSEISGLIQVDNRESPSVFNTKDLEELTVAASVLSFASENARLIERLRVAEEQLKGGLKYMQSREREEVSGIIGESEAMKGIFQSIERVKDLKVPVFINGETGTGKELIARALHYESTRKDQLFVAQNCGALPESLLESELFGHMKGAFTGADRDKKGLFELAHKGTIFLDEVGEMPAPLQSKLLRVLQEGEIWPLGAPRPLKVDVRVLSATHRDLNEMVREGSFRQDLYYRLHVFPIQLPPLRKRGADVRLIADYFLKKYNAEFGKAVSGFSEPAIRCLISYEWPGNVRELQNEIQRALISRFEGDLILEEDLSPHISGLAQNGSDLMRDTLRVDGSLKEMMEHLESELIRRALDDNNGNKTSTAKALGITREGLHKKLTRLGI